MADTTFRTVLPALKAVDNGDGTFSLAVVLQSAPSLTLDSLTFNRANPDVVLSRAAAHVLGLAVGDELALDGLQLDRANRDIRLSRVVANVLGMDAGDELALDAIQLDRTNRDVRLYRKAAHTLGLDDLLDIAVNSASTALAVTQSGAGLGLDLVGNATLLQVLRIKSGGAAYVTGMIEFWRFADVSRRIALGLSSSHEFEIRGGGIYLAGGAGQITGDTTEEISLITQNNKDIEFKPHGTGRVDAQKALYNSSANVDGDVLHNDVLAWDGGAANGQKVRLRSVSELLTILAAATTDTAMDIPANTVIKAVTVRVVTVIPTAATFTVIGATTTTVFNTVAVPVAAGTTNKGNLNCPYGNVAAQKVRITPDVQPAAATGQVRITIFYEDITPPTS